MWTVEDGNVVRIVRTGDETWTSVEVNASALDSFGAITELRLSRDGTRAAMVTASGKLVVAAVVRDKDSVSLALPRTLQPTMIVARRRGRLAQPAHARGRHRADRTCR